LNVYDQARSRKSTEKHASSSSDRRTGKPSNFVWPLKMDQSLAGATVRTVADIDLGEDDYGGDDASSDASSDDSSDEASDAVEPEESSSSDNSTKMVVVDVVIIRTEENISTSRGVNFLNGLALQFGDAANSLPAVGTTYTNTRNRSVDFTNAMDDTTMDVSKVITRALNIPAITYSLNIANATSARNEILARPTLVATTGKTSEFFSGTELTAAAVAGGSQGGDPISIEKEIGVKLTVLPEFLEDGRLNMKVSAQRTFLLTPSADVIFTFRMETSKTTVNANVVMRFGETLILSGLSEKEAEVTRDGTPILQDVPGIQYLFSNQRTRDFQKSVMILLTPRPAQYTYQTEKARKEHEMSMD
jgi:type II secretory pathway component GspD/PulD (secretin)